MERAFKHLLSKIEAIGDNQHQNLLKVYGNKWLKENNLRTGLVFSENNNTVKMDKTDPPQFELMPYIGGQATKIFLESLIIPEIEQLPPGLLVTITQKFSTIVLLPGMVYKCSISFY